MIVSVTVDVNTVRLGDQLMVGGQVFTVADMTALARGARRLDFGSGESFTMGPATVLYALRREPVRRPVVGEFRRRGPGPGGGSRFRGGF